MTGAIHGRSHRAIRVFHDKVAALSVYWIYVSRANYEGVAWPTIVGLNRDTGWSKDTCSEAKALLIAARALEPVPGYIRPAWRNLEKAALARRLNLDKSEYLRPTGYIMVNGEAMPLLYFGGDEVADIDSLDEAPDIPPRRTPTTPDIKRGLPELDSNTTEDSQGPLLEEGKEKREDDSAPVGAGVLGQASEAGAEPPAKTKRKKKEAPPKPPPTAEEQASIERNKLIGAILKAWYEKALVGEKEPYARKGYRSIAATLIDFGIIEQDMIDFMADMRQKPFWNGRGITLSQAAKDIRAWKETRTVKVEPEAALPEWGDNEQAQANRQMIRELADEKSVDAMLKNKQGLLTNPLYGPGGRRRNETTGDQS